VSIKQFVLIAATVGTVTTAGLAALAPDQSPDRAKDQQQQQLHDLGENQQRVHEQLNEAGNGLQDADNLDRLRPVDPRLRPPESRLRWPLP
jgi:hypothetical protein